MYFFTPPAVRPHVLLPTRPITPFIFLPLLGRETVDTHRQTVFPPRVLYDVQHLLGATLDLFNNATFTTKSKTAITADGKVFVLINKLFSVKYVVQLANLLQVPLRRWLRLVPILALHFQLALHHSQFVQEWNSTVGHAEDGVDVATRRFVLILLLAIQIINAHRRRLYHQSHH